MPRNVRISMSRIGDVTAQALRALGLDVRRKPRRVIRSSNEIGLTIEFAAAHLAAHASSTPTVLQVGAYDGAANDPVRDSITRFGWHAVLVEPQAVPFAALQRLYAEHPDVSVFNVAVAPSDGTRDMYVLDSPSDLPEWAGQMASFDRAQVASAMRYLSEEARAVAVVKAVPVETWTFSTLLDRAHVDRVDVLQIDAEGYDLELLRMFDVPRNLPTIVNY